MIPADAGLAEKDRLMGTLSFPFSRSTGQETTGCGMITVQFCLYIGKRETKAMAEQNDMIETGRKTG